MPLKDKPERFCHEYIIDLNATQAAVRAGYSTTSAGKIGHELWKKPEVQSRIQELNEERSQRTQITGDMVVRELARLGFSDVRKLFNGDEQLRSITSLDDDIAAAVASVEVVAKPTVNDDGEKDVEHVHKIKLWDKNSALEKLAKHLNVYVDRVESSGPDGGPVRHEHVHTLSPEAEALLAQGMTVARSR